jgi:hypothetical protein
MEDMNNTFVEYMKAKEDIIGKPKMNLTRKKSKNNSS